MNTMSDPTNDTQQIGTGGNQPPSEVPGCEQPRRRRFVMKQPTKDELRQEIDALDNLLSAYLTELQHYRRQLGRSFLVSSVVALAMFGLGVAAGLGL